MRTISLGLSLVMAVTSVSQAETNSVASAPTGIYEHHYEPQQVTVINNGLAALKKRLDMINSAKKSIDMEYFIYSIDQAGRLITQALIRKAKQGVKIRLIVDTSLPIFELDKYYAAVLKENGIQVRYYNPSIILLLVRAQYRSHRKSLIIDNEQGITGGRNIADEYFDLSSDYNFMDSDMYVRGSIAKDMDRSFEEFWNAKITKFPPNVKNPRPEDYYGLNQYVVDHPANAMDRETQKSLQDYRAAKYYYDKGMNKARAFTVQSETDKNLIVKINTLGAILLTKQTTSVCHDTIFAADFPGIGEKTRVLRAQLAEEARLAQQEVYIESPYFVIKKQISDVLDDLLNRHVQLNVLTNSLYSTDAFYTQAAFDTRIGLWTGAGVNVWLHSGERDPKIYPVIAEAAHARWGTHSKRAVIDGKTTIVGTFNMDPRSTNINAEMALICRNNETIAQAVRKDIQERIQSSIKLGRNGRPENGEKIHNKVPLTKKALFWLTLPLSNIFDFLL
jgi:putative cardiolipin synthase